MISLNSAGYRKGFNAVLLVALPMLLWIAPVSKAVEETKPATTRWQSIATSNLLTVTILAPVKTSSNTLPPTVLYLKNLASPRTGTESDDTILRDFQREGYLVAIIDFAKSPQARVPFINRDLARLRSDLQNSNFLFDCRLDSTHIFIVPEGCRLKRDIVFCRDAKRPLAMDIIFPSKSAKPTGTILEFSCDNENRFGNGSLVSCSDTVLDAEATEGFAVAMADHPVPAPYKGIDPMPDCARKIKAAVRTLRAQREPLGLNGKIVPFGFSRGSGMALMLVTTDGMAEFENFGEHTNMSSAVQGAAVLSGRFTYVNLLADDHMLSRYEKAWGERKNNSEIWKRQGALDYLMKPTVPLFLSINCTEGPDALFQMKVLRERLEALHSPFIFQLDNEPRGHKVPLNPKTLGAMNDYFRCQLN